MKRIGGLFSQIADIDNIEYADEKARKQKSKNWGIVKHDKHREEDNKILLKQFETLTYKTSEYSIFKIYEPKEREISRLPYFPDRIAHHSIMNIMESIWVNSFIDQSYSCIKNRGIHKLNKDLKKTITNDPQGTKYCLKLDIRKFYPSIDHDVLKKIIRRKIKDEKLLVILDGIINSAKGVPIGNYLSQFFANLYLTYFDHWLKEEVHVKHYFRYADDMVILSNDKKQLHKYLILIKMYLHQILNLEVKSNYQIFPVEARGIDFVGYKFYHKYTLIRKSIKIKIKKLVNKFCSKKINSQSFKTKFSSYFGWLKFCDSKKLLQVIKNKTEYNYSNWNGTDSIISNFYNKKIFIIEIIEYEQYFKIHFIYHRKKYSINSKSKKLYRILLNINKPGVFKLKKYGSRKNKFRHIAKSN